MHNHVDNPTPVSVDFLRKIDVSAPGMFLGSPKLDGYRRIAIKNGNLWTITGKKGGTGELVDMPKTLQADLVYMPWPENIGLDCEWVGRRMVESVEHDILYVFDVLDERPAKERLEWLADFFKQHGETKYVRSVPFWYNPGLFDRFQEQMTNPLSEGLVVRRSDSRHLMGRNGCLTHPAIFKIKYRNIREIKHERA